ncbi:energy transducer TonB [Planctobacterium marinum]|uniref:energy transducer TonB n=1 Tax=Planctobacterium marinum TaxID=1631968 RepID=UPI0030C71F73
MAASATVETSPIKRPAPKYPDYALKHKLEGAVLVNFSIEQDGGVSDIKVMAADQDGLFDASTILAVQSWVYHKPPHKIRNNYAAIEYVLSDTPNVSQFSNVERIQIRGN